MARQERRIVVGIDGSDSSKAALRWAIRQAKLTHSSLEAVTAWQLPYVFGSAAFADGVDYGGIATSALAEALTEVSGMEPDVKLRPLVAAGNAAEVLLSAAQGADLLVVGSRGHGGFASAVLGSVSLQCVLHAHCPVLVLRVGREGQDEPSGKQRAGRTASGGQSTPGGSGAMPRRLASIPGGAR